ncbi:hypothetical protein CC1G_08064 [Coprinopsis cinerea okayama7|uniref:Checkpoint protein n=1 Tax=Coprinopsis cinerea (strain Okayama-7 / 130 / ATCC MYA-4618 / FGSC 9003) TaxID=240176 RepID=A8NVL5_COPC7|nr:hypothetical protein CC1G_08064 [Coprinopsis cinerea okayama7\|eukprot:XP_001836679.2 hypothetical protein CC1G_08064 [Coprinopsis cinerea okayama7\
MHIICNSDTNEGGIQVWSQIKVPSLFTNYRIQSNANNEITMVLSSEALAGALRSAAANPSSALSAGGTSNGAATSTSSFETEEVVMKLVKKNDMGMLSFDIHGVTRVGRVVKVTHDVRVDVMKPTEVAKLNEPMCPEPDMTVLLPPLHKIRTIVERLRPMSNILAVRGNNAGCLQLSINTEGVKVDTEWRGCTNPKTQDMNEDDEEEKDPEQMHSVLISIRSFLKFLNVHSVSSTTIACVCHHHCLILYVYIGEVADAGGVLTFYIPAIIDDE